LAAFGPTSGSNSLPTARVVLSFTDGAPKLTQLQVIDPSNTSQFTSFSWDAAHNVKSVTQAGRTMNVLSPETRHDSSLRLVDEGGEFDPQDTWGRFNFPDSSQATFSADPFGNRTREERSVMGFNPATGQTGKIQTVYSWTTRDLNGQATGPNTRQQVNLMGYGSSQNSTAALPSNQYDNLGRLIETSYPDGTSERWGFEPSATANKPSTYIDRGNRVFFYSYQSGRFPTTVVMKALPDPWGAPLSGPTDPRLQTVSVTNYTYLHGRIKTITESDPNGNGGYGLEIEFYYDRNLNPIHKRTTTVDPFGTGVSVKDAWESYGYDQNQNLVWLTSKYLPTTLHQFQLPGGISIGDVPYGNDPKLVEVRTDLSVDAMGRVLSATAPAPQAGGARQTASWTYDLSGRPLSETTTDTNGAARAIKFAYNGNGELIRIDSPDPDWSGPLEPSAELFTRDSNGLITEIRKLNGGIPASLRQFRFDSFGRLLAESMELPGAAGTFGRYEATYREYDALNRVLRVEQPVGKAGSNEPKYLITSAQFSDSTRSVTTSFSAQGIDEPNQDDIIEKFDPLGRKVQTSQGALKQEYLWLDGNTWEGVRGTLLRTTDERGVFAWTKFGPTGKVVRLQSADPDGTGPLLPLNRRYRYDAHGNSLSETEFSGGLSRTSSFTFDFRDLLTSQTSVDGRTTTFEYDLLQRSRKETSPTGATIERQYRVDGLLSRMDRSDLDPNTPDYFETYQYDNLSRLIGSTTPDGTSRLTFNAIGKLASTQSPDPDGAGPLQPLTVNWQYALSKAGLFVSETSDGDGSQTKFDFDSAGRLLAQYRPRSVNPSGMDFSNVYGAANGGASATASERWEYDAAGKLLREFSAKAIGEAGENLVTYQYDRLGRLTSRGDTVRREQFEYSAANGDLLAATDVLGRRTVFTAYDNLGRLLASQRQLNGQGYDTTRVQYDPLGRVASSTALSGESGKEQLTQFQYNLADQLTAQIDALGNSKSYQYNPASGFLTASKNEQGLQQFFAYDRLGRVTASWTPGFSESSGSTRNRYDAMDRVVTSTDPLNNVSSYKFDSLGRIVEQTDPRGPGVNS
ncbi:MAG: hypothetical protein ACKO81_16885, partial [Planctomycetota bacterium]